MPDTKQLEKYLKPDMCQDGDVITFLDPGVIVDKTFDRDGEKEVKPILDITVDLLGEKKTYCPNATTRKLLNKAWGTETEKWVNKKAIISIIPSNNGKDMIIAKPMETARAASQARNPKVSDEEIPF